MDELTKSNYFDEIIERIMDGDESDEEISLNISERLNWAEVQVLREYIYSTIQKYLNYDPQETANPWNYKLIVEGLHWKVESKCFCCNHVKILSEEELRTMGISKTMTCEEVHWRIDGLSELENRYGSVIGQVQFRLGIRGGMAPRNWKVA